MKRALFVTGTDTGIGKTVVTGLFGRFLAEKGIKVVTQKWVQTGSSAADDDISIHLKLLGRDKLQFEDYLPDMVPYELKFPSSPHLAASIEKKHIDARKIEASFRRLERDFDFILVEGTGGALVPINREKTLVDIAGKLGLSVLIVAANRLGAINQTLMTVESLKKRGLRIEGIVFNRISKRENKAILEDNIRIIEKFTQEKVLGELIHDTDPEKLYGSFLPMGERLLKKMEQRIGAAKASIAAKDLNYVWHPYTQMKDCAAMPPIPIARADGIKLYDYDGNFYYDTISSWWCNVHGHNHPVIKSAIKEQLDSLEHVLFAGFTHKPAAELAEKLVAITPKNLKKVFYSDNGSTSVEVALKMSFQYWHNIGKKGKTKFLSLDKAYHGDTVAAMSVSGVDLFNKKFEPLFFSSFKAPAPYCYRCPFGREKGECSMECLRAAEKILQEHSGDIAAVIVEPLLMAAGGMIVYPVKYLMGIRALAREYDVHFIVDEVATGFGRTGKMFACDHAGIKPDLMCLSKGITSGYLPLGATLTTEKIYDAFYGDYEKLKTFYHGHTYTANPVSCAAANASIDLFKKEGTLKTAERTSVALGAFLEEISSFPIVGDTRHIGAVGAMELVKNKSGKEPFGLNERIGLEVYKMALEKNLLLRPLGSTIYLFLPLCVKPDELRDIFRRTKEVLSALSSGS